MISKMETYLGFCIRSGKMIFGVDNIEKQRKGVKLLIVDGELGQNSLNTMLKLQGRFACPMLMTDNGVLSKRLHRLGVKAVAITEEHLASAVLSAVDSEPQFKIYSGGNN